MMYNIIAFDMHMNYLLMKSTFRSIYFPKSKHNSREHVERKLSGSLDSNVAISFMYCVSDAIFVILDQDANFEALDDYSWISLNSDFESSIFQKNVADLVKLAKDVMDYHR